jgi:hypothetical protein
VVGVEHLVRLISKVVDTAFLTDHRREVGAEIEGGREKGGLIQAGGGVEVLALERQELLLDERHLLLRSEGAKRRVASRPAQIYQGGWHELDQAASFAVGVVGGGLDVVLAFHDAEKVQRLAGDFRATVYQSGEERVVQVGGEQGHGMLLREKGS